MSIQRPEIDGLCRVFLCYRGDNSETAKAILSAMSEDPELDFGKVWYSDYGSIGNYHDDIPAYFSAAEYAVLFIDDKFTAGFLDVDGSTNEECTTALEVIEMEKRIQEKQLKLIAVNIDGKSLNAKGNDKKILDKLFKNAGIYTEDSASHFLHLNHNDYNRRQANPKSFVRERLFAIAKKKDEYEYYYNKGLAAVQSKKENAKVLFSTAIKLDSTRTEAYIQRGILLLEQKDYKNAVKDFSTVININPKKSAGFYYRGEASRLQDNFNDAILDYNEAIKLLPNEPAYYKGRALAYRALQHDDEKRADELEANKQD